MFLPKFKRLDEQKYVAHITEKDVTQGTILATGEIYVKADTQLYGIPLKTYHDCIIPKNGSVTITCIPTLDFIELYDEIQLLRNDILNLEKRIEALEEKEK